MSDTQDYADLNKPLPDPGPRDGKHGEGDNWEYNEHGQTATTPDDKPRRGSRGDDSVEESDKDRAERHD